MLKADLHMHSTVSDGSDTIEELIAAATLAKLDAIAITDHDTLSHLTQIPKETPLKVLTGIEISAIDPKTGTKAHILGYNIENVKMIEELTAPTLKKRHENSLKQIEILRKNNYLIDLDAIARADKKYIYKQHIMGYLCKTGQAKEMFGEFYKRIFKNGGICHFDIDYIDVFTAVEAIKAAGGNAVLAHSGQQQNFYLVEQLVPVGLMGIEYNHPENKAKDKEIILQLAKEHNLFLTGGSDMHGENHKHTHSVGSFLSEQSGALAIV